MQLATCVYRIYVHTEEPHCPLPTLLIPFCEEGQTMDCQHYQKILEELKKERMKA